MSNGADTRFTGEQSAGQARTRRTRAAVVEAAQALFLERGYAATTIAAISDLSDTPQATVYRLFASKIGILKSVLDVSIGGDDQQVAVAGRPQVRGLVTNPDPNGQLTGFASFLRNLMARTAAVHRILVDAARSDVDAASLHAEISRQRQEGQRRVARSLARSGALRPGMRERNAADVIHALASPEVYGLLVLDRRWSGQRYETWLVELLADQLLAPRSGAGADREWYDQNAESTERKRKT